MRDPGRIEPLLALLRDVWYRHPDLRIGQLLEWALARAKEPSIRAGHYVDGPDLFQAEDHLLASGLRSIKIEDQGNDGT